MVTRAIAPTIVDIRDPEPMSHLDDWVAQGLIAPGQADAIRAFEHDRLASLPPPAGVTPSAPPVPERPRRISLVAEAVGYLGAALVGIAGTILLSEVWGSLAYAARLGLVAVVTLVLVGTGAFARRSDEPAAQRLASFAWVLSVGGFAWLAGLLLGRDGVDLREERLALGVAVTAAASGWTLYRLQPDWLQHVLAYLVTGALIVAAMAQPATTPEVFAFGIALTALAIVWLLIGAADRLPPGAASTWVGLVGLLIGLNVLASGQDRGAGLIVGLVAAAALLTSGVLLERVVYLGFGAATVFLFVPQAVFHFFGDTLGAPVALLIVGVLLLGVALAVVRVRRATDEREHEEVLP